MKTQFLTKATLGFAFVGSLSILNADIKIETLKGDSATACEVLLCLSSPIKPPECYRSLAKYFAIKFKKPWKTMNARKSFLKLCPVDKSNYQLNYYMTEVLPYVDEECTIPALNKRVEKQVVRVEKVKVCISQDENGGCWREKWTEINIYGFRTNPNPPRSCALLSSSAYTDYHLKYTCNKQFYEKEDWNRGYTLKEVSKNVYFTLKESEKEQGSKLIPSSRRFNKVVVYYQKIPIRKDCWINDK